MIGARLAPAENLGLDFGEVRVYALAAVNYFILDNLSEVCIDTNGEPRSPMA